MTSGVTYKLQVDLRYELRALTETFLQLSAKLSQAAKEMHDPGIPPSEALLAEVTAAQADFVALRTQLLGLARVVETSPLPEPEAVVSLRDLVSVLQAAQDSRKKSKMDEAKQQVLHKLDRIQDLIHTEKAQFRPLADCQALAAQLKLAITPADWTNPSPDLVEQLLPFVDLLRMVEQRDQLNDEALGRLQESVAKAFGRLLAVAVARGRVVLRQTVAAPVGEVAPLPAESTLEAARVTPETRGPVAEEVPPSAGESPAKSDLPVAPASTADAAPSPDVAPAESASAEMPPLDVQDLARQAAELYTLLGHQVQRTITRPDHDVDLIIRAANGKKWMARCHSQLSPVSESDVGNFMATMQQEKAAQGAIITWGVVAPQARQWAKSDLLYLLDQKEFLDYLQRARSRH